MGLDFLGIGAQKCGTTWLYTHLNNHPEINFPAGKEIHFWDQKQDQGFDWYTSLFPDEKGVKQGEFTPAYAILSPREIKKIHHRLPDLKLLYIIRDPVDRAWSAALHALKCVDMTIDEASDWWLIDHIHSKGSVMRGDYETCMNNWLKYYDEKQLLLLNFEDIAKDPRAVLKKCARHLGVDPKFYDKVSDKKLSERIYEGDKTPIRESLIPIIEELYEKKVVSIDFFKKAKN